MTNWFQTLGYKLRMWMYGRNGMDAFGQFLLICAIVVNILSYLPYLRLFSLMGTALLIWEIVRFCSKNLYKRQQENAKYWSIRQKASKSLAFYKKMWQERATHRYFKCKCGTRMRVPKGKGKIEITCPKCQSKIIKKT